ncbi:MAG: TRAP-type mannitol/chloroaromatic compound transport system permease small subunit [Gammaproteobacteria bacterium]|jgi:TRAP-type mannitol/chloroaromatic compound transport system permease small subunit
MNAEVNDVASRSDLSEAELGAQGRHQASAAETPKAIIVAESLRRFVDAVGRGGSWLILPVVLITCFDVIARKLRWVQNDGTIASVQLWLTENGGRIFESTILQELEWHSHTALFALVLGYGYIWNTHVRVDLVRENLAFRSKAWVELFGLTFFLMPYLVVVLYFACVFMIDSYNMNEISASTVGLTHRFIIKGFLAFGLLTALIAGISVWLQVWAVLFGPQNIRYPLMTIEWPEEQGMMIEGKERLDLSKAVDTLEQRARDSGHLDEGVNAADGKSIS